MKKLYFALIALLIFVVGANAQYTEYYNTDFSEYTGQIEAQQVDGADIWKGANQASTLWNKVTDGMGIVSTWRGANLIGYPLENWQAEKSVQVTLSVKVKELTGFTAGGNKEVMFGITERAFKSGTAGVDAPTYDAAKTIGFEFRDLGSSSLSELQVRLLNKTGQNVVLDNLALEDVIKCTFTITKTSVSGVFEVDLVIDRNETNVTTLTAADVSNTLLYTSSGENTVFTTYYKTPLNVDGTPTGANMIVWNALKLEMEESSEVAPVANAGVDQEVTGGALVTLDGSSNYDGDPSEDFAWTAPAGITLTGADTSSPTFTAPDVSRVTNYTISLVVSANPGSGVTDSPADEVVVTVIPAAGKYESGDGSTTPYIISTADHLYSLSLSSGDWGKKFEVKNDIDFTSETEPMTPIGIFTGEFNGNNKILSGLSIEGNGDIDVGLFAILKWGGQVTNLGLVDVDIEDAGYARKAVGAIVGYVESECLIDNCFVSGGTIKGNGPVGGIAGKIQAWAATGNVDITAMISNCYVDAYVEGDWGVGGIVGSGQQNTGGLFKVEDVAFYGTAIDIFVDGTGDVGAGAAIVSGDISGFGEVVDAYYEVGSGVDNANTTGDMELAEADLDMEVSYAFDFTSYWKMSLTHGYAILKGFADYAVPTDLESDVELIESAKVFVAGKILYINNVKDASTVYTIYNLSGVAVADGEFSGASFNETLSLEKGVYIVKVGTEATKVMIK